MLRHAARYPSKNRALIVSDIKIGKVKSVLRVGERGEHTRLDPRAL